MIEPRFTEKITSAGDRIEKFLSFFNENEDKVEEILYGGSGGSKSHSTCQHLVETLFNNQDIAILITRKTGPALRATTWRMIREILDADGYIRDKDYTMNLTSMEIRVIGTNSFMLFTSVDEPQKLKSSSYNIVYIEEITEFTQDDVFFLRNTLRRPRKDGRVNQLVMTFNPIDINHWVWQNLVIKANPATTAIIHSTHWDNPFLPDTYRKDLEHLAEQDENFYRVYCLGEPGILEHTIYRNYTIFPFPDCPKSERFYGIDFGFNNPSFIGEFWESDQVPYVRELLYESRLTNTQLIDRMNAMGLNKDCPYYCDSAEPARIQELKDAGYNSIAADKSVKDGIDYVKRRKLHIDPESTNIISEIRSYSYRKKGDQILDEPVKFRDHAMDGSRYALYTHSKTLHGEPIPLTMISFGGIAAEHEDRQFIRGRLK